MLEISPIFHNFTPSQQMEKFNSALAQEKTEKTETQKRAHGAIVAFSLLGFALLSVLFLKNNGGFFIKHLNNTKLALQKERNKSIIKQSYTIVDKIVVVMQKVLDGLTRLCNSISNIMPIKDIAILKVLNSNKITKAVTKKVNKLFRKTAIASCTSSYNKAFLKFDQIQSYLGMLSDQKSIPKLKEKLQEASDIYHKNFFSYHRNKRLKIIDQSTYKLKERVQNTLANGEKSIFTNMKRFGSYIVFDLIEKDKQKFYENLLQIKRKLTVEPYHKIKDFYENIDKIRSNVDIDDIKSMNLIKEITTSLDNYKKALHKNDKFLENTTADKFILNLKQLDLHLNSYSGGYQFYDNKKRGLILQGISKLKENLGHKPDALLQECLEIVKTHYQVNSKEYDKTKRLINNFSRAIDKATNLEGIGLFEKLAELKIGSGPNDVVGVVLPALFAVYLTLKAETKEEKISTALQTSIPIVGGVSIAVYGTVRMYAGAANLMLGVLSALGLNIVGTWVNKTYKSYMKKSEERQLQKAT